MANQGLLLKQRRNESRLRADTSRCGCEGCVKPTSGGHLGFVRIPSLNNQYIPSRELTYPPDKAYLKMIFLFPRRDMLISWRVMESKRFFLIFCGSCGVCGVLGDPLAGHYLEDRPRRDGAGPLPNGHSWL